jgi:hypothetical protein
MRSFLKKIYTKAFVKLRVKNDLKKISKLTAAGKWEEASCLLTKSAYPLQIQFLVEHKGWNHSAVRWNARSPEHCLFAFNPDLPKDQVRNLTIRLLFLLPLIAAFHRSKDFIAGAIFINLGDYADTDGIAFCSNRDGQILIPDTDFLGTEGYSLARSHFEINKIPWEDRRAIAFWRGNTTGIRTGGSWNSIPRIQLCEICNKEDVRSFFDVGLSGLAQIPNYEINRVANSDLMRDYFPMLSSDQYKYQIDIDGNSNAWSGLFQKLLSGSAILKVASPYGFRQWYYDRLIPWEHFVPVESDMIDLVEKAQWLIANDHKAMLIGQKGAELASNLSYDLAISDALQRIHNAFLESGSTSANRPIQ